MLFRRYEYRSTTADTTGVVFQRVCQLLGAGAGAPQFYLADHATRGTSAVARAIKRFPALAPFGSQGTDATGTEPRAYLQLSSLDARFAVPRPAVAKDEIEAQVLAEIADGIPKRFPFAYATFVWPRTGWPGQELDRRTVGEERPLSATHPTIAESTLPGVLLTSQWWTTRREVKWFTTVRVDPPPPDARRLPDLPEGTRRGIDALGRIAHTHLYFRPDLGESAEPGRSEAMARIVEAWKGDARKILREIGLPHDPPEALTPLGPSAPRTGGIASPHKQAMLAVFQPRGYRYASTLSGHGIYVVRKPTARGNVLYARLDVGTWSHHCAGFLQVAGLGWHASFTLHASAGPLGHCYPIADEATWARAVQNVGAVVDYLEKGPVAAIEALSPPAPGWFESEW